MRAGASGIPGDNFVFSPQFKTKLSYPSPQKNPMERRKKNAVRNAAGKKDETNPLRAPLIDKGG